MPSFSLAEIWKSLVLDRHCQKIDANLANSGESPVKRVEQNLWKEVSRKGADSGGCHSPIKERNLKIKPWQR